METAQEFTARANRSLTEAKAKSPRFSDDYSAINRWMAVAKQEGKSWVDGLIFAIEKMSGG
jgi:hypothetical protein